MDPTRFDHLVKLSISGDRLEATVVIQPGLEDSEQAKEAVVGLLQRRGVAITPERVAAIEQAYLRYHANGGKRLEMQVAHGTAPRHGRDETLELSEEVTRAERAHAEAVASGDRVDHYSRSVFCVVRKGQVIGRIRPATRGVDGVDVGGAPISARHGKPLAVRFDPSLKVEPNGEVVAQIDGLLERSETRIAVVPVLHIAENVDFSTGHVNFPGDVRIDRSVRDCFRVVCGRSLEVNGLVEAANIETGMDARFSHGMAAREKGTIRIGRDLHAKYLDNVHGSVGRDLIVAREIRECELVVGRRVASPTCTVMGGSLISAGQMHLAQLGGEGEGPCEIALGKIPDLERLIAGLLDAMDALAKRLELTDPRLESAKKLRSQHQQIASRILQTLHFIKAHTIAELTIDGAIFPGSVIWAGPHRAELVQAVQGPVRIWIDDVERVQITDLKANRSMPLEDLAKVSVGSRYLDLTVLRDRLSVEREAA